MPQNQNLATRIHGLATRLAIDSWGYDHELPDEPDTDTVAVLMRLLGEYPTLGASPKLRAFSVDKFKRYYADAVQSLRDADACPVCGSAVSHLEHGALCCHPAQGHMPEG